MLSVHPISGLEQHLAREDTPERVRELRRDRDRNAWFNVRRDYMTMVADMIRIKSQLPDVFSILSITVSQKSRNSLRNSIVSLTKVSSMCPILVRSSIIIVCRLMIVAISVLICLYEIRTSFAGYFEAVDHDHLLRHAVGCGVEQLPKLTPVGDSVRILEFIQTLMLASAPALVVVRG